MTKSTPKNRKELAEILTIRELLKVPKELRIAQFIYNQFRDYEESMEVMVKNDGKFFERSVHGINIFYVEDKDFLKHINKPL